MPYTRQVFTNYSPGSLTTILRGICGEIGITIDVSVRLAEMPQSAVDVVFHPYMAIEIIAPASFTAAERRDYFTNHWIACFRLFLAAKERRRDLVGCCRLWNDDFPSGAGLCFSGNAVSHIAFPDPVFMETDGYAELRHQAQGQWIPWEARETSLFWRGASTGVRELLRVSRWQDLPRFRLCLEARAHASEDILDIGISQVAQIWDETELAEIAASDMMRPHVPLLRFMCYKYAIDVDGNTCGWASLFSKLLMGNTVVKVASAMGWRQWYYDRLVPWKNFVPLSEDCRDVLEVAKWLRDSPAEAADIAEQGRALARDLTFDHVIEQATHAIYASVSRFSHPH